MNSPPLLFRAIAIVVLTCAATSGCVTSLGYVPENIKVRQIEDKTTLVPTYAEVKKWAYDVQDGLDTRVAANRYALYAAGTLAAAAIGALSGLAVFSPGSSAISGIPIGTAFLSGTVALYSNDQKADMYDRASKYVKKLISMSNTRLANGRAADAKEAACLKADVDELLRRLGQHVRYMDPKNVVELLKGVKAGTVATADEKVKAASGDLSDLDSDGDKVMTFCDDRPKPAS